MSVESDFPLDWIPVYRRDEMPKRGLGIPYISFSLYQYNDSVVTPKTSLSPMALRRLTQAIVNAGSTPVFILENDTGTQNHTSQYALHAYPPLPYASEVEVARRGLGNTIEREADAAYRPQLGEFVCDVGSRLTLG